jgi:hypothetical protein
MGERREGVTTFFFTVGLSVYMAAGCQLLAASCCAVMIDVWGSGVWGRWIYCVPALVRPPFSAFPLIGHILAHHSGYAVIIMVTSTPPSSPRSILCFSPDPSYHLRSQQREKKVAAAIQSLFRMCQYASILRPRSSRGHAKTPKDPQRSH